MKRTLIALATAVAVTTTSITAAPAATTTPESSVSEQTSSAAETTAPEQLTAEPKEKSSSGSKGSGWSPTGSTPIDLVLLIAGALGISFLVQPLLNGNLDQVINDLKKQFNLPM